MYGPWLGAVHTQYGFAADASIPCGRLVLVRCIALAFAFLYLGILVG
jgi:hypothetical protein